MYIKQATNLYWFSVLDENVAVKLVGNITEYS